MVEIIDLSTVSPAPVIVKIGNGDEIEECMNESARQLAANEARRQGVRE